MEISDIIEQKKLKKQLSEEQWRFINNQFKKGTIKNPQMVALLIACRINGCSKREEKILEKLSIPKVEHLLIDDRMQRVNDMIELKSQGKTLPDEEIEWVISEYNKGAILDEYIAALLMAIQLKGMSIAECCALTRATIHSGEIIDFSDIQGTVDKHSTGGVGDKVSFPLIAAVSANGAVEPMLTIRSLGHTGGTVNKLESIPGINVNIPLEKFKELVKKNGLAMSNLPDTVIPVDKKLLKLRQETQTIDSVYLKSASILSEKLASGVRDGLAFDIKLGSGAFFKDMESAVLMAKTITTTASGLGVKAVGLITNMDQPLGEEVGNENEIKESIKVLKGKGPWDTTRLVIELGAYMLQFAGKATNIEEGREKIQRAIDNGSALKKFRTLILSEGGDEKVIDECDLPPHTKFHLEVQSSVSGYIEKMATDEIGKIVNFYLGTNVEQAAEGKLDHSLGITVKKKVGDKVQKGDVLAIFHINDKAKYTRAKMKYLSALKFSKKPVKPNPLIYKAVISTKPDELIIKNYKKREI